MRHTIGLLALIVVGCHHAAVPSAAPAAPGPDAAVSPRLRIINGSPQPMWIFWMAGAGGGTMSGVPHQIMLAPTAHQDYPIPDRGLAGTRFWPGVGCDSTGNNCAVGQSGGPASEGFTCPSYGCAPPVDSKFEGTFGCLPSVPSDHCQLNPSNHQPLPRADSWDTSMVDGFTLPFTVRVVGSCPGGPVNNQIDCRDIALGSCPTTENLSTNGAYPALASENMLVVNPQTSAHAGCYSDCGRLTFSQWNGMSYAPAAPEAQMYCCPTPPIQPTACRLGPVATTGYTRLVHRTCMQVYAYGYDDGTGLFGCPAGVRYEVTFYTTVPAAR